MAIRNPYSLNFSGTKGTVTTNLTEPSVIGDPTLTKKLTVEMWCSIVEGGRILRTTNGTQFGINISYWFGTPQASINTVSGGRAISGAVYMPAGLHHYALIWEDGSSTPLVWIVDGVVKSQSSVWVSALSSCARTMIVGWGAGGPAGTNYNVDELRIWDHARSLEQIQNNMYKRLRGTEQGLALYYRFDEGEGADIHDASPSGLHGSMFGATWVPGLVDLVGEEIVTGSITFHGHASASFGTPIKKAVGSITFRGHASMIASAVKTAVGSITFRGVSTMTLIGLVLRELEGIYQISSSEIFSRNQPILPTDLANHIEVWINPLVPAAEAKEVYRSKEAEEIPAGGSRTFRVDYDSKPVIEAIASLEEAGLNLSITDTKYYSSTAEITVTNAGATAQTCVVVVKGKPLELQGRRKIVMEDPESVLDHGRVKYKFDSPLVQDERSARIIGAEVLRMFAVARANIEIDWRGDPALELADPVQIPEFERRGVSKKENFYIVKQKLEGDGGLEAVMAGRKIPEVDPLRINPWTDILFPFEGSLESSDGRYKPIGMSEGSGEGMSGGMDGGMDGMDGGLDGGLDGEGGEIEEEIIETPPDETPPDETPPDEPDDGKDGAGEGEVDALWH